MKFPFGLILASCCALAGAIAAPPAATAISMKSLLAEMVDADSPARLPASSYRCLQASSHDRHSVSPDKPGWFANADWSHCIREEQIGGRTEAVMMEDDGPGAIVRMWFTWFGPMDGKLNHSTDGVLRIYLDGATEPVIAGTLTELLVKQGLVKPPFAETTPATAPEINRAYNIYLPIPYAKGCKVTYESKGKLGTVWNKGEALYYALNYRKFAAGTRVDTFTMADLAANAATIARCGKQLADAPAIPGNATTARLHADALAPGAESVLELTGPAAIRQVQLRLDGITGAPDLAAALRGLEVQLDFDKQPCVRIPAGDFFATGTRIVPFKSRYFEVTAANEMICRWVMPFAKTATLRVVNKGQKAVAFDCGVTHAPWEWNGRSLHFHAVQSPHIGIQARKEERGARDINFATLQGKGRLVGDTLAIRNTANRGMKWWGEGDEKISVDGEGFPSHFGTGTEDYYGYAHCRPEAFSSPFHAQPYGNGNLEPGPTPELQSSVNTRLRLLDDIPFDRSLKFDMELWHWQDAIMDYVPTVFYYLHPDQATAATVNPAAPAARTGPWPVDRARQWMDREGWRVGANFLPSTAANQHEMWSAATFDSPTLTRELDLARATGFNTLRVYLHDRTFAEDPAGFLNRMDTFLGLCSARGIKPLFVFFDDCWLCPTQSPTLIPAPRPGTHNSCWLQSPGSELVRGYPGDAALKQRLHTYVHTVLSRFAEDPRILAWDLYNEPGNRATIRFDDKGAEIPGDRRATPTPEGTKALLEDVFAWAWEVNPAQPLTSGVWSWFRPGDHPIARVQYDRSDVISFHNYGNLQDMRKTVTMVRAHAQGRPIICTEYMARPTGSTFQDILPFLAAENISAINWGFVSGKSQTICSWTSWKSPELPPRRWFHDIYHPDGKAYDPAEVECIRKTSAAKITSNTPNQ